MKKILAFALALAMILTCSFALADRLDDIKAAGKLTVATSPDWPPYEYIDDDGNIVGTDILMCQWMAEQLGVELEIQPMAFDACLAAVGQGDVDMMVAGLTYDEESSQPHGADRHLLERGRSGSCSSRRAPVLPTTPLEVLCGQDRRRAERHQPADYGRRAAAGEHDQLELVTKIPDGVNMVKTGRVDASGCSEDRL